MDVLKHESMQIGSSEDIVAVRQFARGWAVQVGFTLVDQTKIVTAASELARNTLQHGGGGTVRLEIVSNGPRTGLRLTFQDSGPGIPDMEQALTDGYSSAGGLGLGLGGARRLSNEFALVSRPGEGTTVTITRWR
jgi:serine/threonine-protein kinase RsbT